MTEPAQVYRYGPLLRRCRGHLWFMRRYGVRKWASYERTRRSGVTIDYGEIFSPDERAVLAEHLERVPWHARESR